MDKADTLNPQDKIELSKLTEALIKSLNSIKARKKIDELSKLTVSQTVSFFAILYERVRNAVEYREDHQVRRAAIERMLRRRLAINPGGKGEAENLIRELLWARYYDNGSLSLQDVDKIQEIIDKFQLIKKLIITGRSTENQQYLNQFIVDLLTCEIEETLSPEKTQESASYNYFIFQVLRNKIRIEGLTEDQKDAFFLAALERAYRRSDNSYQRYHLFTAFYKPINEYSENELKELSAKMLKIFKKIQEIIKNPYVDNLTRFIRKQLPPFLVLFDLIKIKFKEIKQNLTDKQKLWSEVDIICREKYQQIGIRLRTLALRSFIYIFLTKMVFALILEFPLSQFIYNEVNMTSILINTIFPPLLMLFIVFFFKLPDEENTKKIHQRIIQIIDAEMNYESALAYLPKKQKSKKPIMIFGFTVFYSLTFIITFSLIYEALSYLNFNLVSMAVFVFFVSIVTFFSFRIKQFVNEYRLVEKEAAISPIFDFFFMPVLSLGKFLSGEIAKLNFFIFIFDFLIEAPFKFVFEIVEEWISFVKKRKEEII